MKEEGELAVELHTFLASEFDGGEGSASHPGNPLPQHEKKKIQDLSRLLCEAMRQTFLKDEMLHFQGREHIELSS